MGIAYKDDEGLEFLAYCSEGDLRSLAHYLIFDTDGKIRRTAELLDQKEFWELESDSEKYRKCWKFIAGELQHFGGDSIVNLFRNGGVNYREILTDVCDKMSVTYDKKHSIYDIEDSLLVKILKDATDKMSDQEKDSFIKDTWKDGGYDPSKVDIALMTATNLSAILSLQLSRIIATQLAKNFAFDSFALLGKQALAKGAGMLLGPIGIAINAGAAIPAISGTAYRVTIPSTLQIAYMRRKYQDHKPF